MSLIKCTECGYELSDKADACPKCGCPMGEIIKNTNFDNICIVNGHPYDLSSFVVRIKNVEENDHKEWANIIMDLKKLTDVRESLLLYQEIRETGKIPEKFDGETFAEWKASGGYDEFWGTNKPKCPHCGSTNIKKVSATSRLISTATLGIASNKIGKSFQCCKCKYTW